MALDPDDPRPPYQQVAGELRAAILSRKLLPGEKLPSGAALAAEYGVARMTVQQAIRLLRDDSLVVSRQGSGVFVRVRTEDPVGVGPHLERAFTAERVAVDYSGFSAQALADALAGPLDKLRTGRLAVRSLHLRILVPDGSRPWVLPAGVDGTDRPAVREELAARSSRGLAELTDAVHGLRASGLVGQAEVSVRVHPLSPSFRLYLINDDDAVFGFYPVVPRTLEAGGREHRVYDVDAPDETVFHHSSADPESSDARYVEQAREWFDSVWATIARDVPHPATV